MTNISNITNRTALFMALIEYREAGKMKTFVSEVTQNFGVSFSIRDIRDNKGLAENVYINIDKFNQYCDIVGLFTSAPETTTIKTTEPMTTTISSTTNNKESELLTALRNAVAGSVTAQIDEKKVIQLIKKHATTTNEVIKYINRETKNEVKLELKHNQFDELLTLISCGLNVWITGGAGGGKTHAAHDVAKVLGLNFYTKSISAQSSEFSFLGFMNAAGQFVETDFYKAYTNGGIFCLDEIDNGNPNVLSVLNSALANGSCSFANGVQQRHKDFIVVATANTIGRGGNKKYVGRLQIDSATLDRFALVHWNYDENLEVKISGSETAAKYVQNLRKKAEAANLNCVISPRASISISKLLATGCDLKTAANYVIFNKLTDNEKSVLS